MAPTEPDDSEMREALGMRKRRAGDPASLADGEPQAGAQLRQKLEEWRAALDGDMDLPALQGVLRGTLAACLHLFDENEALAARLGALQHDHGDMRVQITQLVQRQQEVSLVVHTPAGTSPTVVQQAAAFAGGTQPSAVISWDRLGGPRTMSSAAGQPPRNVQTWKITLRADLAMRAVDGGHRLAGQQEFRGIFISEDLTQAERTRKKEVVSTDSFKEQRQRCRDQGLLVRWRKGLPYWLGRQQRPHLLLSQPFEVTKQYLPEPPATGGPANQQRGAGGGSERRAGAASTSGVAPRAGGSGGRGRGSLSGQPPPSGDSAAAAGALVIR